MLGSARRTFSRFWMDEQEYRANISGLQIVFGAVLGFVLAGAEAFDAYAFGTLLLATISGVVTILYISASPQRLVYTALALTYGLTLPYIVQAITGVAAPEKLAPTLLIWTVFQAGIEFAPRRREPARQQ